VNSASDAMVLAKDEVGWHGRNKMRGCTATHHDVIYTHYGTYTVCSASWSLNNTISTTHKQLQASNCAQRTLDPCPALDLDN
jgi:hypothetical protein